MNENGKVTLRNSRINEIHLELKQIPVLKDQGEMVYALGRNINILRKFVDETEDARKKLLAEHFGSTGENVLDGDPRLPKFRAAFQDILDLKIELEPYKFPSASLKKADLSPSAFAAALALIEP